MKNKALKCSKDIPIFLGTLFLWVTEDFGSILNEYGISENYNDRDGVSFGRHSRGIEYHIMLHPDADDSVLVHEIVHTCNAIMKECHIKNDVDNDETQAYLTAWLYKELINIE